MKSKWQKEWIKYLWSGVIFVLYLLEIKNKLALGESMGQENFSAEDGTSSKCWEALTFTFSKNKKEISMDLRPEFKEKEL